MGCNPNGENIRFLRCRIRGDRHPGAIQGEGESNLRFSDLTATDSYSAIRRAEMPSVICGKPGAAIEDLDFQNVRITAKGGHPRAAAEVHPEENDGRFPAQIGAIPAYGFYLRHARDVRFRDCEFRFEQDDGPPAFVVDDGEKVVFERCELQREPGSDSAVSVRNGPGVTIRPKEP